MQFRPEVWYPIGGLIVLGMAAFTLFAISISSKADPWVRWGTSLFGSLCFFAAGVYATRDTWIYGLIGWVAGLYPVILFVLALVTLAFVFRVLHAFGPDKYASAVTMTMGLGMFLFLLPSLSMQVMPDHGKVWVAARDGVASAGSAVSDLTGGLFW